MSSFENKLKALSWINKFVLVILSNLSFELFDTLIFLEYFLLKSYNFIFELSFLLDLTFG